MTPAKLRSEVTRAVQLDRQIADLTDELKQLKASLLHEAGTRPEEHVATDGGGWTWTAEGSDGCIARVTAPAPSLKSKIDGEGKAIEKIRSAAGRFFDKLFKATLAYKPVDNFRTEAEALLDRQAGKLIRLCETESSPKVAFETKELA